MATIAFTDIVLSTQGLSGSVRGTLRLTETDGGTLDWSSKSGASQKVSTTSITAATWVHVGRDAAILHVTATPSGKENENGGNDADDDELKEYYRYEGFALRDEEVVRENFAVVISSRARNGERRCVRTQRGQHGR